MRPAIHIASLALFLALLWGAGCSDPSSEPSESNEDVLPSELDDVDAKICDPADCDDGNPCTLDECMEQVCLHTTQDTGVCDDGDSCTKDSCDVIDGCKNVVILLGETCDDGDPCTLIDACSESGCAGTPKVCPPNEDVCIEDVVCEAETGNCVFVFAEGTPCDDGNICTQEDTCSDKGCNGVISEDCEDNNVCTNDECDALSGCVYTTNTFPCDDNDACTENDTCLDKTCGGEPVECEEGSFCVIVECNPESGCSSTIVDSPCEDGNFCTFDDNCADGFCIPGTTKDCDDDNPCTTDTCNSNTGECFNAHNTEPCDAGDLCNSTGNCENGQCANLIPDCVDEFTCTLDVCDPIHGCTHLPNDTECDDDVLCNGAEVCSPSEGCVPGDVPGLNDGISCTVDLCDEEEGITHLPIDAQCTTDAPCNADYCDVSTGGCAPAVLPDCCGNGLVETGEDCDDNNEIEGDGCTPSCLLEDTCPIWTKTILAQEFDTPEAILYLGAPGYAIAGTTLDDPEGSSGFLTFINTKGSLIDTITYGAGGDNTITSLIATDDGGYAMAGGSNASFSGTEDFYLIKTNAEGVFSWARTIGGDDTDRAHAVLQTEDNSFALAGRTTSFGAGGEDAWLVRLLPSGDLIWANAYGGVEDDVAWDLIETSNQEFTVVGSTFSAGGDQDGYLFHTLSDGTLLWEKKYNLGNDESFIAGLQTADGGYILAGTTTSAQEVDLYVVRTDDVGAILWEEVYDSPGYAEFPQAIQFAEDGGLLIVGHRVLPDGTNTTWATRWTLEGLAVWEASFAGDNSTRGGDLAPLPGGGFTLLSAGDLPQDDPIWIFKTNAWGHTSCEKSGICESVSFAQCDDGESCNGVSVCDPVLECIPLNPLLTCCGNGELNGGEECDDENAIDGDGCSSSCAIEP